MEARMGKPPTLRYRTDRRHTHERSGREPQAAGQWAKVPARVGPDPWPRSPASGSLGLSTVLRTEYEYSLRMINFGGASG